MQKVTLVPAMKTIPVATSTIVARVASIPTAPPPVAIIPKVNAQVSNYAPDSSGKKMIQYEALIGNSSASYPTTAFAERACLELAAANGCINYAIASSDSTSYSILAW